MFILQVIEKGLDGINESSGTFYDLILMAANGTGSQIFCGSSTSYANAKTLAGTIFAASLTWNDTLMNTSAFYHS
jgi:hypothetical protein